MSASMQPPSAQSAVPFCLIIWDMPPDHKVPMDDNIQSRYKALNGNRVAYTTTYFGMKVRFNSAKALLLNRDAAWNALFPGGKLLNGTISSIAATLHNSANDRINFQCNPQGVVAFVKDRMARNMWQLEHITLHFTFKGTPDVIQLNANGWTEMLKRLRHDYPLVKDVRVCVDEAFWEQVDWQSGALPVYEGHTFIQDLGLIAPPKARTIKLARPGWPQHMFGGSELWVRFGGCDSKEKWDFAYALQDTLDEKRDDRPVMFSTAQGDVKYVA